MIQIGVTIHDTGGAIVVSDVTDGGIVRGIESLPFDVDPVAERVRDLVIQYPDGQIVIDGDGLGDALWKILYAEAKTVRGVLVSRERMKTLEPRGWLYEGRGIERQRLVNALVVAMNQKAIHFAAGLAGMDAMTRALVGYRRQVKEDGLIGPELVVALCLTILPRVKPTGNHAFLA